MTKRPDDGGPAFPMQEGSIMNGLSARDYFAGQALIGLVDTHYGNLTPMKDIAYDCYAMADAMLAERYREVEE